MRHKARAEEVGKLIRHRLPGSRDIINSLVVEPPETDSDDEVTKAVRLVLDKDPFMKADHIRVYTKDHIVTLEGRVPNDSIREMAEFDAWDVCGGWTGDQMADRPPIHVTTEGKSHELRRLRGLSSYSPRGGSQPSAVGAASAGIRLWCSSIRLP
jgi:hypothetical protein